MSPFIYSPLDLRAGAHFMGVDKLMSLSVRCNNIQHIFSPLFVFVFSAFLMMPENLSFLSFTLLTFLLFLFSPFKFFKFVILTYGFNLFSCY